jgi:hypothetical protein
MMTMLVWREGLEEMDEVTDGTVLAGEEPAR